MTNESRVASYEGASAHYLSAGRRDQVKQHWEEPASAYCLARALTAVPARSADRGSLDVLDVGAGTGDGLRLLRKAVDEFHGGRTRLCYLGIDSDPEMVQTGRALHRDEPDVAFERHDVRNPLHHGRFDVVMSAGVPYSHLTPQEMHEALVALVVSTAADRPVVFVVDVLGRHSVEWPDRWGERRWEYPMSFFSGTANVVTGDMTFYTRDSLWECAAAAARTAGVRIAHAEFHDRSVAVGRHTATRALNPSIPEYRSMVNSLHLGDVDLPLADLAFHPPSGVAPGEVHDFFRSFSTSWNTRLAEFADLECRIGASDRTREALAQSLRAFEHGHARGLGVGHSLTGVFLLVP